MMPMGNQLPNYTVFRVQHFILCLAFNFGIFLQGIPGISQGHLHLHGRSTSLGRMGLIHNNSKVFSRSVIYFLIDNREFLQGCNNNPLSGIYGILKILGGLLFPDSFHTAKGMVKTCYCFL